ncbi:hypothetical protein RCL_jg9790.t1 [Rhizophagus clarus]|uniref:Uncharacterized protein n=1 Tax=Rhizophagus clarus TaxID=94130 RepID=A0A8H3M0Q0_9GLOM|nr:hypothetical protein RCL_jg9790.t1 [Rhizophagus clarus]
MLLFIGSFVDVFGGGSVDLSDINGQSFGIFSVWTVVNSSWRGLWTLEIPRDFRFRFGTMCIRRKMPNFNRKFFSLYCNFFKYLWMQISVRIRCYFKVIKLKGFNTILVGTCPNNIISSFKFELNEWDFG